MLRRLASAAAALALIASCQVVGGFENFSAATALADAGSDTGPAPHPCDPIVPTTKVDAKGLAVQALVKPSQQSCFWADKYEVSIEQYRRFLDERADGALQDATRCAWKEKPSDPEKNTSDECRADLEKRELSVALIPTKPIRCVDWCDAREFCLWAGKDLCTSQVYFANLEPLDAADEWGFACAPNGDPYPYGLDYQDDRCNIGVAATECTGSTFTECPPQEPERFPKCTGEAGTKDMIGNVAEWTFLCNPNAPGPEANCAVRGGSFADPVSRGTCLAAGSVFRARGTRARDLGFRCCSVLTVGERSLVR